MDGGTIHRDAKDWSSSGWRVGWEPILLGVFSMRYQGGLEIGVWGSSERSGPERDFWESLICRKAFSGFLVMHLFKANTMLEQETASLSTSKVTRLFST